MSQIKIVLIGSGAVAAEVTAYIKHINDLTREQKYEIIGYADESPEKYSENARKYNFSSPYFGGLEKLNKDDFYYLPAFSDVGYKKSVGSMILSRGLKSINLIHPSSIISSPENLGIGNIIYPFCIIGPNVKIGNFNLLTSYSCVSHDSKIGDFNFLASAVIAGNSTIEDLNFFGLKSTVIPNTEIGSMNKIQAGMIVDKKIGNNEIIFHRYKEKIILHNE